MWRCFLYEGDLLFFVVMVVTRSFSYFWKLSWNYYELKLLNYYLEIWPQQNVLFATIKWLHRQARRKKMLQYFVRNSWHFTFSFTTHKRALFELHNSLANFSLWLSHALFQVESYHLGHQTTTDIDLQIVCNEPKTQR